jgi:hypothetical protein
MAIGALTCDRTLYQIDLTYNQWQAKCHLPTQQTVHSDKRLVGPRALLPPLSDLLPCTHLIPPCLDDICAPTIAEDWK